MAQGNSHCLVLHPYKGLSSFLGGLPVSDADHYRAISCLSTWAAADWVHGKNRLPPVADNILVRWRFKGFHQKAEPEGPTQERTKKHKGDTCREGIASSQNQDADTVCPLPASLAHEALRPTPVDLRSRAAPRPGVHHVQQFLASKTKTFVGNRVQASVMFANYKRWAKQAGKPSKGGLNIVTNMYTFGRILRALGFSSIHVSRGMPGCKGNHYIDIELRE